MSWLSLRTYSSRICHRIQWLTAMTLEVAN